jgi:hypothetical protein
MNGLTESQGKFVAGKRHFLGLFADGNRPGHERSAPVL